MKKILLLTVILFFSHAIYAEDNNEARFAEIFGTYTTALSNNMNVD